MATPVMATSIVGSSLITRLNSDQDCFLNWRIFPLNFDFALAHHIFDNLYVFSNFCVWDRNDEFDKQKTYNYGIFIGGL